MCFCHTMGRQCVSVGASVVHTTGMQGCNRMLPTWSIGHSSGKSEPEPEPWWQWRQSPVLRQNATGTVPEQRTEPRVKIAIVNITSLLGYPKGLWTHVEPVATVPERQHSQSRAEVAPQRGTHSTAFLIDTA
ncbi:hypothetical protein CBOM_07556 [Ceraceosorus bombacis]|uniref:Uncharacterized protein n=1 Tax=Ceraceosorus bombacis TaxID=401625 RepID=A0A0P1BEK3_9BASI|nr:hypothetical protein CBOM_07556 [Ceraceosorus bombacis]